MNGEQAGLWMAAGGAVALILLVACAVLWRASRRLAARVDALEADRLGRGDTAGVVVADPPPYVITALDDAMLETADDAEGVVSARIDGTVFADIVARETVIRAAGLAHGLRRALSAETRHRIRFEMKREVKRSRKQRRTDMKAALRDFQARERARPAEGHDGEDAA